MKKTLSALLATTFLAASLPAFAANGVIDVYVNNEPVVFDTNPEIVNDRTFVPLRAIAEALGSEVEWDGETQSITLTRYDVSNYLQIGSIAVRTYGDNVEDVSTLEAAPYIKDDRTMVPIRFISEGFGMQVEWDGETQSVYITYEANSTGDGIVCYDGFSYVPDFGKYYSITPEPMSTNEMYFYTGVTDEQIVEYMNMLLTLGFEFTDEMQTNEVMSFSFEKGDEQLVVANFSTFFGITVIHKQTGIKGELKYYDNYPSVPDYGAVNATESISKEELADNITVYTYARPEGIESGHDLNSYLNTLQACGFEKTVETFTTISFANKESNNVVIIEQGVDSITVIVEDVPEEFR